MPAQPMEITRNQNGQRPGDVEDALPGGALLLDLEVSPSDVVLKIGAVLGEQMFYRSGRFSLDDCLTELTTFAKDASCVVGHNLIRHDLPVLCKLAPQHSLHRLPVIDTLFLSPIAFPENPYHRLIKDYKLVHESLNDPVADARLAAAVFADEMKSLAGLRESEPGLFSLLHFLLATPDTGHNTLAMGMEMVFSSWGGQRPNAAQALILWKELLPRWACASFPDTDGLIQTVSQRWALAYAATWLRVAGNNSVLPPWVRLQHPLTTQLLTRLREKPCFADTCAYCRRVHNAREQLKAFFGFDEFRAVPENGRGGSMQQDIIEAGLRNESLLAMLPTGGGKSLCFQLPALVRNYRRGLLTIVISPLQALMKDQVDGLVRRTSTVFAAALHGMLTPPERGDVLRRVQRGDVAILYVSPEQLRNRSFHTAISQREIGCWVFDEAHCLSKWGHDFRTDYLYAGRYIRTLAVAQGVPVPPVACFTATAKRDVRDEITAYFKTELGLELRVFEGGVERTNLVFEVQPISDHGKMERVHDLLGERLAPESPGSAIVFRSTRNGTQELSEYLRLKGWQAEHFHAGLTPVEKKRIQDDFLGGKIRVICATNAFGMGIDKDDVRLVIHADLPASLENYLQEAGRAGRDGKQSECVLLFDPEDCEQQFRLGAFSELSRRDIAQILRGLRKAARGGKEEVVITAGEILRDEEVETDIDLMDRNADTKVRTAISWLERAGFLQRDENVTSVFQVRPSVRNLEEAWEKIKDLKLSAAEQAIWLAILRAIFEAESTGSLTVDQLALLPELAAFAKGGRPESVNPEYVGAKILKILGSMSKQGLLKRDLLLNAYVRYKIADHSGVRLERVLHTDRKLLDVLAVEEPDPEGWMPLHLRSLNQKLLEEGCETSPDLLRSLLKSVREDWRGHTGGQPAIDLRYINRESYRVRILRGWSAIAETAEKRRRVAKLIVDHLLARIPAGTAASGDLIVEFSFEEMRSLIEQDLWLAKELKDIDSAIERALMFLHEQQVIVLQQGLAVFRSAMTIRLQPDQKREKYKASDYQPLAHHYGERTLQVHVITEYARRALAQIRDALKLVLAYFTMEKEAFTRLYFGSKPD
jgi:ATP-dependent DNA helicase RecQ